MDPIYLFGILKVSSLSINNGFNGFLKSLLISILEFTSDFAFLEMIHRLIVCVFEALCLHRSTGSHPGGATPGKLLLGLRVVSCTQVWKKIIIWLATLYSICYRVNFRSGPYNKNGYPHKALRVDSTSTFRCIHMGWIFCILETCYDILF